MALALSPTEEYMTPKIRAQHKNAVRQILAAKLRNDWHWTWPESIDCHEARLLRPDTSNQDVLNLENDQWIERAEWESDVTETETPQACDDPQGSKDQQPITGTCPNAEATQPSELDFPGVISSHEDAQIPILDTRLATQKARRYSRISNEVGWNDGLLCFLRRQEAWTCARLLTTSLSIEDSVLPGDAIGNGAIAASAIANRKAQIAPRVPIAPAILPADLPLRAAITPAIYDTIYLKIVSAGVTPNCPINLSHVVRACVKGWKSSGAWPPQPIRQDASTAKKKNRMVEDLFSTGDARTGYKTLGVPSSPDPDTNAGLATRSDLFGGARDKLKRMVGLGQSEKNSTSHVCL